MEFNENLEGLNKTWFIDLDGTLLLHNAYKTGEDVLLPNTIDFISSIDEKDFIILTTARKNVWKEKTIEFLKKNNIRYNHIIFDLPTGPRMLINDNKPDGTKTAFCINVERDKGV
jgi:hypothetical protein